MGEWEIENHIEVDRVRVIEKDGVRVNDREETDKHIEIDTERDRP